jgi:hypothetical protein
MYRGGQDPIERINRFSDRVILLHQKDFPHEAPQPLNLFDGVVSPTENIDEAVFIERKDQRCFTEIGTGILPIQNLIDAASKLPKLDYMLLEQDHTTLPEIESIRRSHDAFLGQVHRHHLALSQAAILDDQPYWDSARRVFSSCCICRDSEDSERWNSLAAAHMAPALPRQGRPRAAAP